jgi:hypothetical protein
LKRTSKKLLFIILVVLGVGGVVVKAASILFLAGEHIPETPVEVVEINARGKGAWLVPRDVTAQRFGIPNPFVHRIKNLRIERLAVEVVAETEGRVELRSNDLEAGDLLVVQPAAVQAGQAVSPTTGIDAEGLIRLTLEAGIAAVMAEDLKESVRFISTGYHDSLGFNFNTMRRLLERAYEEFDEPRIELAESPAIQLKGSQAIVQAQLRLTAIYQGRRNYLLGDQDHPNNILLILDKSANGWKVSQIEGLRPLSLEEGFLKLLGAQIGLPLTATERLEKQQACMPCRQRMAELFGPGR